MFSGGSREGPRLPYFKTKQIFLSPPSPNEGLYPPLELLINLMTTVLRIFSKIENSDLVHPLPSLSANLKLCKHIPSLIVRPSQNSSEKDVLVSLSFLITILKNLLYLLHLKWSNLEI